MRWMCQMVLVFAATVLCGDITFGQLGYTLYSLEWLVADADTVVRGVVVDVSREPAENTSAWSMVTLDVREVLKGHRAKRLKFAVGVVDQSKTLEQWKTHKVELLWFLDRQKPHDMREETATDAQRLDALLARDSTDLYATGLGRAVMPLAARVPEDWQLPPPIFTIDLKLLENRDDILKAAKAAVGRAGNGKAIRSHRVELPGSIAQRTGHRGDANGFIVPIDDRLEAFALHLIQSPGDFLPKDDTGHQDGQREKRQRRARFDEATKYFLRQAGVKALEYFKSDENVAVLKPRLDDPGFAMRDGEGVYGVREAAYETLRTWGIDVDKPVLKREPSQK